MPTDTTQVAGRAIDLLVIGGGILGAAIAREAALRGDVDAAGARRRLRERRVVGRLGAQPRRPGKRVE